jgi:hypothetical protein
MRPRIATLLVLGAALSLVAASANAQVRSERRIPVTKEAKGEVVPPRVDTVTVYRTDTLRIAGADSGRYGSHATHNRHRPRHGPR